MKISEQSLRCNGSGPVMGSEKLLKDQGKSENLTSRVFWFSGQFQDVFRDQVKDKNPYKSFSILGFAPPGPKVFRDSGVADTPLTPTERNSQTRKIHLLDAAYLHRKKPLLWNVAAGRTK